jgi:tetratricopeptide (TPR) repeat protein
VIDKGIVGVTTPVILAQLEDNLTKYRPDMVVIMVGFNDRRILIPEAKIKLFQRSKVYKLIRFLSVRLRKKPAHAVNLASEDQEAYLRLGAFYQNTDKYHEAEAVFIKCIERNPGDAACYAGLGEAYNAQRKLFQAEQMLEKAIEMNPHDSGWHATLGRVYETQGNFPRAEEAFAKGIESNPADPQCYAGFALMCIRHRKFLQAEELFKKALERIPNGNVISTRTIDFYWQKGKFSEIEEVLQKFLAVKPSDDLAYRLLEMVYREMNKTELAEKCKKKREGLGFSEYRPMTINNYHKLKEILDRKGIRLVCVQYPVRSVGPLKKIFQGDTQGLVFVDNERVFKDAVKQDRYSTYFIDIFAGDFGHCTDKGNRLLAENIANTILKEVFHK